MLRLSYFRFVMGRSSVTLRFFRRELSLLRTIAFLLSEGVPRMPSAGTVSIFTYSKLSSILTSRNVLTSTALVGLSASATGLGQISRK